MNGLGAQLLHGHGHRRHVSSLCLHCEVGVQGEVKLQAGFGSALLLLLFFFLADHLSECLRFEAVTV